MDFCIQGKTFSTPRLLLRAFRPEDLEDFYAYASVEGVGEMAGWKHHSDRKITQKVLDCFLEKDKIYALEYEGRVVGSLELVPSKYLGETGGMLGFVLAKPLHRKGLMTEALQAIIAHAFEVLDLDFLESGYFTHNKPSEALHRKLGFRYVKTEKHKDAEGNMLDTDFCLLLNPRLIKETAGSIRRQIEALSNPKRIEFEAKLNPDLDKDNICGLSIPQCRSLAKSLPFLTQMAFCQSLPHRYQDENLLHSLILNNLKNEKQFLAELEHFKGYINAWAVCDVVDFRRIKKERERLWAALQAWRCSGEEFVVRLALVAMLGNFLDERYAESVCKICPQIEDSAYYVHMALAWLVAEGLVKHYELFLPLLTQKQLGKKTHNKAIQKATESFRIEEEKKIYLKSLRRKSE